jgi:type II secretory pathway pseudopilin PulG
MMILKKKNIKGFTLVETIIYVLLFSVVMGGVVSFGLLLSAINAKNLCIRETQANARTALNFISSEIKSAKDIVSPEFGNSSTVLVYIDQDENSKTIKLDEGILIFVSDGEEISINRSSVLISDILFKNLSLDNETDSIQFSFDYSYYSTSSKEFYSEGSLRSAMMRRF